MKKDRTYFLRVRRQTGGFAVWLARHSEDQSRRGFSMLVRQIGPTFHTREIAEQFKHKTQAEGLTV